MSTANDALENFMQMLSGPGKSKSAYASGLGPENLQMMGKEAASKMLKDGIPMNDTIVKLASALPNITPEQVKRVVEFANESAYLTKHAESKEGGSSSSYPQFDLADPGKILSTLGEESKPSASAHSNSDFQAAPPKREKMASAKSDKILAEAFGIGQNTELTFSKESAVSAVIESKQDLVSLKEHLEHSAEQLDMLHKTAQADYYLQVRNHILEGNALADAMIAARSTGAGNEKIASVMRPVVERLLKEKVAGVEKLKAGIKDMDKVAHRVVNPEHPLVKTFGAIVESQNEIEKLASGLKDVDTELDRVNNFIKEQFRAKAF